MNSIFNKKTKEENTTYDTVSSLSHTKWNCKYHIVFTPKYRRKIFYGQKRVEIGKILYEVTGDEEYLDLIKRNIDASPETISYVSILSYCKPCQRVYNILADIYINNNNSVNRSTAVMGILYNKGIIKDRDSIKESNDVINLRKKFKSEDSAERQVILKKFENGELTL